MAEFRLSNFTSGTALTAAELNTGLTYTTYTPDWIQSVAITKTVNWARYTKFGKLIIGTIKMTASSAGTANNKITVSLPVNANTNNLIIGTAVISDFSNTKQGVPISVFYESASTMSFSPLSISSGILTLQTNGATTTTARLGQDFQNGSGATVTGYTVASSDEIWIQFQYEAA